ncbi:unnamed protein product [Schistocephalus solidus]|uniref:Fibronectin type-III domain-containing protein n=1 Tax=Schistocephalus solidus TaxID=70667 RepID=A0A3P7D7E4_SCHSO|nr:unnamed protein product [Schistocephalus solidus]
MERRFELHHMQPASQLSFRVCAVNSAGASPWSAPGSCVMPPSYPDQPFDLGLDRSPQHETTCTSNPAVYSNAVVDGVSLSSANLIWTAPLTNGCPITPLSQPSPSLGLYITTFCRL